jgi:hypothetical protein
MEANRDERPRALRRIQREPSQVALLFQKAHKCDNVRDKRHFLAQANAFLRIHIMNQTRKQTRMDFRSGCAQKAQRKLFTVKAMILTNACGLPAESGRTSLDRSLWRNEILHYYGEKWAVRDLQKRASLLDLLAPFEGQAPSFGIMDVLKTTDRVKRSNRCDNDDLAMSAVVLTSHARPDLLADALHALLASRKLLEERVVLGQIKGKKASISLVADLARCILPLPATLELADVLITDMLKPYIDHAFPAEPGIFIGGLKGTQTLEVSSGLQSVVEKSLDDKSRGAIADLDIASFYDEQSLFLLLRWLLKRCPPILAAAAIKIQFYPEFQLRCGDQCVPFRNRSREAITGSRLANLLARIPIQQAIMDSLPSIRRLGYPAGSTSLLVLTWIDNRFSAPRCALDACTILATIAHNLYTFWNLRVKLGSMHYLSVDPDDVHQLPDWEQVDIMECLGHFISADGTIKSPFARVRALVWKAYFSKFRRAALQHLDDEMITADISRHLQPVYLYRAASWPFQHVFADKADRLQAQIIAAATAVPRLDDEPADVYHKRRCKLANALAEASGRWSLRWAAKSLTWRDHVKRNTSGLIWSSLLDSVFDEKYLRERRRIFVPRRSIRVHGWSEMAGRTDTRLSRGSPAVRSFEGHANAVETIQAAKMKFDLAKLTNKSEHYRKPRSLGYNIVKTIDRVCAAQGGSWTSQARS